MKKNLIILMMMLFSLAVNAQEKEYAWLKSDYRQVQIAAHVKIKSIEFAAPDVHPLYVIQSEVIESFKGRLRRGQALKFYIGIEDGEKRDLSVFKGDWIVFLKGKYPTPKDGKGWYELENSRSVVTKKSLSQMRRIKRSAR